VIPNCEHVEEFMAYRILYMVYTANFAELSSMYGSSFFLGFDKPLIQHAEMVRIAVEDLNWYRFRVLCGMAPKMTVFLLRKIALKFRVRTLICILKSHGKSIPLNDLKKFLDFNLGFDLDTLLEEHMVLDKGNVKTAESLAKIHANSDLF
jgi:hypothetical protein